MYRKISVNNSWYYIIYKIVLSRNVSETDQMEKYPSEVEIRLFDADVNY